MSDREKLASWMIANGFATGHGDSLDDLLKELKWQVDELKRERELLLRAAYINGAEMASHYFGQEHEPPSLARIEAEFSKWRTEEIDPSA